MPRRNGLDASMRLAEPRLREILNYLAPQVRPVGEVWIGLWVEVFGTTSGNLLNK